MTRLEKGTLNDHDGENSGLSDFHPLVDEHRTTGNSWYLKAIRFPTGDVEMVALKLARDDTLKKGGGAVRKNKEKSEMGLLTLTKSQRRAKKIVRHRILTIEADRILTLTYRENMKDINQAWKDFNLFNRKMKKLFGLDKKGKNNWQYVCVPEYQDRGAVHFHLAVKGFQNVKLIRHVWRSVIGQGNIDVTSPINKKTGRFIKNPKKISGYLSKYITKNDSVEFNRKRYSSSTIVLPVPMNGWLALGMSTHSVMVKIVSQLTRKVVQHMQESENTRLPIIFLST